MVVSRILLVLLALFMIASPAMSAETTGPGIGMGISVLGAGIGIGVIGFSALASIARQPEQAGTIRGTMILLAGLIEGAAIIGLVLCLVLMFV